MQDLKVEFNFIPEEPKRKMMHLKKEKYFIRNYITISKPSKIRNCGKFKKGKI